MEKEGIEKEVIKSDGNFHQNRRIWSGIFLVIVGGILFLKAMGVPIPAWLLSWQMFLIGLGFLIGIRHRFRNPSWLILMLVGSAFLVDDYYYDLNIHNYIWPAAIMLLGLFFILRPKTTVRRQAIRRVKQDWQNKDWQSGFQPDYDNTTVDNDEVLDITAVFGGVKKRLISKTFRGGDITAFMGGVEIDLTGTDIPNNALLDITAVFGGIKLIIPADWKVQNKATVFFGAVEDKRNVPASFSNKLLIIDGSAVFGGIELRSYN